MRTTRLSVLSLVLTTLLAVAAAAGSPIPGAKYSQLPNNVTGYAYSSQTSLTYVLSYMADDWTCPDGLPITDIHWWGSYWLKPNGTTTVYSDWLQNAPNGGIDGFVISIWDDAALQPGELFRHPGNVLATLNFSGDCGETPVATTQHGKTVYQYYVDLDPADWFHQEQGKVYWLSIQAVLNASADDKQWGWQEGLGPSPIGVGYAVQQFKSMGPGWYVPCGGHDLAFELTAVPEPGGFLAMTVGVIGIVGLVLKRRA